MIPPWLGPWRRTVVLGIVLLGLGGCAETAFLAQTAKEIQESAAGTASPRPTYKIGKPYQVDGVWYYPKVDYQYRETGIASWYGPEFHGKRTANGELFDMNRVSAAHRTLPLPSMVRVTNLENGRAINVRVNDRGPFARGRIIDLSRRAAQLLGFEKRGTALVRVEILPEESRRLAALAGADAAQGGHPPNRPKAAPRVAVTSRALPPPPGAKAVPAPGPAYQVAVMEHAPSPKERSAPPLARVDERVDVVPVPVDPKIYVQAGAFAKYHNALRVHTILKRLGPSRITQVRVVGRPLFRVRIGPLANVEEADRVLAGVVEAGFPEARTIVD